MKTFGDEEFEIGVNTLLNYDYERTGKYKASYELVDGDVGHVIFTLTLTGGCLNNIVKCTVNTLEYLGFSFHQKYLNRIGLTSYSKPINNFKF